VYTADPSKDPTAKLIERVEQIDETLLAVAGEGSSSSQGTGGMATKLQAARLAVESGTTTVIGSLRERDFLLRLVAGETLGTRFIPRTTPLESRKRWLLSEKAQGFLTVDAGAKKQIIEHGASLLPVGVIGCEGEFERGAVIGIRLDGGVPFAFGIANYSSGDIRQLFRVKSPEIEALLGYSLGDEVIHRDNLVAKVKG
jgi:glutamate 5-kinase